LRRKKLPGQSIFARRAHFLKGGPMELGKTARSKRRRKSDHQQERRVERGEDEA